jgi:hypothetical protein
MPLPPQLPPHKILVLSKDLTTYSHVAKDYPGAQYIQVTVTATNYAHLLDTHTRPGDMLLNLAVGVGTLELVKYCQVSSGEMVVQDVLFSILTQCMGVCRRGEVCLRGHQLGQECCNFWCRATQLSED